MLGLEGRRDSSAAPVCREPEKSRAMENHACLPLPKKALKPSSAPASGLSASAMT